MTDIREIAQLGAPVLRQKALPVEYPASPATQSIIAAMFATLASTQGVGLAAPQISEPWRIIIIASRPTPRYPYAPLMEPTVMINPVFQALSNDMVKDWEGCLSVPGLRALVPRYKSITIEYQDQLGRTCSDQLVDFPARVFQHEHDHLEGRVYLDSVENNHDIFAESEYFKQFAGTTTA